MKNYARYVVVDLLQRLRIEAHSLSLTNYGWKSEPYKLFRTSRSEPESKISLNLPNDEFSSKVFFFAVNYLI